MNTFEYIKSGIYLVLMTIVSIYGLSHCIYGLIVNVNNQSILTVDLNNLNKQTAQKNRYLKIQNATSKFEPVIYIDDSGSPVKYLYLLTSQEDSLQIEKENNLNLIIESKFKILDWKPIKIKGLLNPYWSKIDESILQHFEYQGMKFHSKPEYLKVNNKPWKWYWNASLTLIILLFFYRMLEAIFKN